MNYKHINDKKKDFMKTKYFLFGGIIATSLVFSSCKDDDNDSNENSNEEASRKYTTIIDNYVDNIVIPTYAELKDKSETLLSKVETFVSKGTDASLKDACDAWRATREPWEESEAFLFGPAATYNLDPSLDDWPLDKVQIENYLKSDIEFDPEALGHTVRGFHTLEYLLFENGKPRSASSISDRQKDYMIAVATGLRDDSFKLWYYWNGDKKLSEADKKLIEELEPDNANDGFGARFKNPNMYDQAFKTEIDVIGQIVDGCTDISGEVGEQKIGGPFETKQVEEVESWYSWNSLDDYKNNILSIQHSYLGTLSDNISDLDKVGGEKSISYAVSKVDADLDNEIRTAIKDAYNAVDAIPAPFRSNLNAATEIKAAMNKLAELTDSLEKIKKVVK